jgi:hypothetical protein
MNRATYSAGIARLDTVSRLDRFLRDRETPIGPSYVQSILFGRRWMRGTTQPQRVVLSDAAPAESESKGPDPCAS